MHTSMLRRVMLLSLAAVTLVGGSATALQTTKPAVAFNYGMIANSGTEDDWEAEIDGRLVVWEHKFSEIDNEIGIRNLATGETRYLGAGDGFVQGSPDVSGDRVVYVDNSSGTTDIKLYHWSTNTSVDVSATGANENSPRIDGTLVIWQDQGTGYLWYRDMDYSASATRLDAAGTNSVFHDVDNGRIWWSNPTFQDFRIAMVRPPIISAQFSAFGAQPEFTHVHGDRAVYGTFLGNPMQYNMRSRMQTMLATNASSPTVFHDTFAWLGGDGNGRYSRPGHDQTVLTDAEGLNRFSMYGPRIVWDHNSGGDWDVAIATAMTKLAARTAGANRYATAAAVSREYFAAGPLTTYPQIDNVVLCTGENFPDALAAAPLARALQAPLLLTKRDALPPETAEEIARLAPTKIYIVGGEPAVSAAILNQLDATYDVERIAGADRYETSAKVAVELHGLLGDSMGRAFFARGDMFPDALALGPIAAGGQGPILLVKPTSVPASVASVVDTLDIKMGYIAGDTGAVSTGVAFTLDTLIAANGGIYEVTRFAGANRYETAIAIVEGGLVRAWIDLDTLGVATGSNFPDALGGGSAMGYYGSAVVLTSTASVPGSVSAFLDAHAYDIGCVDIFGGTGVVSDGVMGAIVGRLR